MRRSAGTVSDHDPAPGALFGLGALDWGHHLLTFGNGDDCGKVGAAPCYSVDNMLTATLIGAFGIHAGPAELEFGVSVPFVIMYGDRGPDISSGPNNDMAFKLSGQGIGNVGLHFKTRFLKTSRPPHVGLGIMASVYLPTVSPTDRWLGEAKTLLETAGIDVPVVTSGNSPDMWHTGDSVVTERRPGTYIYFDRSQVGFGAASFADCALTVLTTVVSRPTATRVVVDAGSKSLSSDLLGQTGHGAVQGHEDVVVTALSEEHGVIELAAASDWPRVGERLRIIPNHACVVSNLFDEVQLLAADGTIEAVPVAARGRVD